MKKIFKFILIKLPIFFLISSVAIVFCLKWVPVSYTPLMLKRSVECRYDGSYIRKHKWTPLEDISKETMKAVLAAEDSDFFKHEGFDNDAMLTELERFRNGEQNIRGCSTISQQTAKNVFTFGSPTWLRKIVEAYYTLLIENIWGKARILEVYLNVVELGKGVYGIGAASEIFYHKSAKDITMTEAASLAVCLPSPLKRNPLDAPVYFSKRRTQIINNAKQIHILIP